MEKKQLKNNKQKIFKKILLLNGKKNKFDSNLWSKSY